MNATTVEFQQAFQAANELLSINEYGSGFLISHVEAYEKLLSLIPDAATKMFSCQTSSQANSDELSTNDQPLSQLGRGDTFMISAGQHSARVRVYRRGGFIRFFNSMSYLGTLETSRVLSELRVLTYLQSAGIEVCKPLAGYFEYVFPGVMYRCAIATEEVSGAVNLLVEFRNRETTLEEIARMSSEVGVLVEELVDLKVFHCDLFPGNVLKDPSGRLVLIDFDKAQFVATLSEDVLKQKYFQRWARACNKHLSVERASCAIDSFANVIGVRR